MYYIEKNKRKARAAEMKLGISGEEMATEISFSCTNTSAHQMMDATAGIECNDERATATDNKGNISA